MSDLVWGDPPVKKTGRPGQGRWQLVLAALGERPGEWARVDSALRRSSPTALLNAAMRAGVKCETTARKNDDGLTWSLYARVVT